MSKHLTLYRMDLFGAGHGWGGRSLLSKICHTYTAMMKLGTVILCLKKTQKYINHVTHSTPPFFHRKSATFAISKSADIDCVSTHNFLFF